jgi:DNA-binding IscR family transcriptional regulator
MPAKEIVINNVLKTLGGALFDKKFCEIHSGTMRLCTNSVDCSSRSLWQMIQYIVDQFLDQVTLYDLVSSEKNSSKVLHDMLMKQTLVPEKEPLS